MSYTKSLPKTIQSCFSSIADHYDRANAILSFGMHVRWNRALVKTLKSRSRLLDLCAGTGEIAFTYLQENPEGLATLLDFCPKMLGVAQRKGKAFEPRFVIQEGDAQALPFDSDAFDAISIAYGIRNVQEPMRCFREVYRVLQKGGVFSILELTRPKNPLLKWGHALYLATMLPILGQVIAKNRKAYSYLGRSIQKFFSSSLLREQLSEAGFVHIHQKKFMGGVATLMTCKK